MRILFIAILLITTSYQEADCSLRRPDVRSEESTWSDIPLELLEYLQQTGSSLEEWLQGLGKQLPDLDTVQTSIESAWSTLADHLPEMDDARSWLQVDGGELAALQSPTALEQYIHTKVNRYRQSRDLQPLRYNEELARVAREHSKNMASGRVTFGHGGSDARSAELHVKIHIIAFGENVAFAHGYNNPGLAFVNGWIGSDGHRANMEGNFAMSGVGIAESWDGTVYATQVFASQ